MFKYLPPHNIEGWNKTQIAVIWSMINLLVTHVVCDQVNYSPEPVTNNGSYGKRARCKVSFCGTEKPDIMLICWANGVCEVREFALDSKGRETWVKSHAYI